MGKKKKRCEHDCEDEKRYMIGDLEHEWWYQGTKAECVEEIQIRINDDYIDPDEPLEEQIVVFALGEECDVDVERSVKVSIDG